MMLAKHCQDFMNWSIKPRAALWQHLDNPQCLLGMDLQMATPKKAAPCPPQEGKRMPW